MATIIRKGISKDNTYIAYECKCTNNIDTYIRRFLICDPNESHRRYGIHKNQHPNAFVTIKGIHYECYFANGKSIKIPYDGVREYDGLAVVK